MAGRCLSPIAVFLFLSVVVRAALAEAPAPAVPAAPASISVPGLVTPLPGASFSQQIIINNNFGSLPAAVPPPAGPVPATVAQPSLGLAPLPVSTLPPLEAATVGAASSARVVEAAAPAASGNGFRLTLSGGAIGASDGSSSVGGGLGADLHFFHYFGLELEGILAGNTNGSGTAVNAFEGMAHAKFQIPFRSPLIDFTPKIGIGYVMAGSSYGSANGLSLMAGGEVELFHFVIAGAEYVRGLSPTSDSVAPVYSGGAMAYQAPNPFLTSQRQPQPVDPHPTYQFLPDPSSTVQYQRVSVTLGARVAKGFQLGAKISETDLGSGISRTLKGGYLQFEF